VQQAIAQLKQDLPSFAIRERSYFNGKDSCILMEDGRFYGMGYVEESFELKERDDLRKQLLEYPEYDFVRNIIKRYALEQPDKVVWL
jgi:DNA polymerase-3 subunit epsilon